jgi:hypothetical protein
MTEWFRADPVGSGIPHPARVYDFWLGGKDNLAADRAAGKKVMAVFPGARKLARANRGFLVRTVRYLSERGVSQFIDLGTGFPTRPNVHKVARPAVPDARVLYVDNDPVVTAHNRALRATTPGVAAIDGDLARCQRRHRPAHTVAEIADAYSQASATVTPRTTGEVAAWFGGFEMVPPGLTDVTRWFPGNPAQQGAVRVAAGVGRWANA